MKIQAGSLHMGWGLGATRAGEKGGGCWENPMRLRLNTELEKERSEHWQGAVSEGLSSRERKEEAYRLELGASESP